MFKFHHHISELIVVFGVANETFQRIQVVLVNFGFFGCPNCAAMAFFSSIRKNQSFSVLAIIDSKFVTIFLLGFLSTYLESVPFFVPIFGHYGHHQKCNNEQLHFGEVVIDHVEQAS